MADFLQRRSTAIILHFVTPPVSAAAAANDVQVIIIHNPVLTNSDRIKNHDQTVTTVSLFDSTIRTTSADGTVKTDVKEMDGFAVSQFESSTLPRRHFEPVRIDLSSTGSESADFTKMLYLMPKPHQDDRLLNPRFRLSQAAHKFQIQPILLQYPHLGPWLTPADPQTLT